MLAREAMAERHRPTRIPMSSEDETRRSTTHHAVCRRKVEPLTERVPSEGRGR